MIHPKSIVIDGTSYSLKHLWPKNVTFTLPPDDKYPEQEVPSVIYFSNHCVSIGAKEGEPHNMTDHNGNPRIFCPDRYKLSSGLKKILKNIPNKKCLFVPGEGYLLKDNRNKAGQIISYHIYFTIDEHNTKQNALAMWVTSAYIKTTGRNTPVRKGTADNIRFANLARKTLGGEVI